uniref:Uncharacterized protein LOC108042366 n=1 Tax=Drosophila rhopaloa TaxID=1041015 RepID=A0A6P4ED40_DRORH
MKGITLIVLCTILVLSSLINVTYAINLVNLNFPSKKNYPSETILECRDGYHIVVRKGILYYNNGMTNEKAWYAPKMACDFEKTCRFKLVEEQYNYLNLNPRGNLQLTIQYDCKQNNYQGTPRRIKQYGQIGDCPHDSFVQKHVAYFNDNNIASDSQTAQMEREVIAMSVCGQVRRFRVRNPNAPLDPSYYTVYLIHEKNQLNNNFVPSEEKCQLTGNALARSFKYQCRREANKWTCNFESKGEDLARHYKSNGHIDL